jgi:hypothetical protein
MRRRIKPKVTWLPRDPAFTRDFGNTDTNIIQLDFTLNSPIAGEFITGVVPVVSDATPLVDGPGNNTLSDIENSGYRLRRIVGKCFVARQANQGPTNVAIIAGGGFIVLRTAENGDPLNINAPNSYSPFALRNDDSPWIWRRDWMLSGIDDTNGFSFPRSNAFYGSVADGPHIDQKTARIIGHDERLFFVASVMNVGSSNESITNVDFTLSLRVLASMRTSLGNRRNASR